MNLTLTLFALLQVPRGGSGTPGDVLARQDTTRQLADTLAGAAGAIRDTLTRPPLPEGVAAVVRAIFRVPQWIQIGGVVLALVVAVLLTRIVWKRRRGILAWFRTASPGILAAVALGVVLVLGLSTLAGAKSWNCMQHDNGFCAGCHVMAEPFGQFELGAGKHRDRECHDCHQQSIWASSRQLVLWVAARPDKIRPHAPVPDDRCEGCHQLQDGKEPWEHALYLAGHKVHFESDSSALKDLTCVTCHGQEVHKFIPSARTCQQSGCHENQSVRMNGMIDLPEINCVTCHDFTADLPALASRDSAVRALIPAARQCQSCHPMEEKLLNYDITRDPHNGSCGMCHDVHADSLPIAAIASCTNCHTDLSRSAFHVGANHRRVQQDCLTCHQPHAASVDASDCVGCHAAVRSRSKLRLRPPLPFDTAAAARRITLAPIAPDVLPTLHVFRHNVVPNTVAEAERNDHRGKGDELPVDLPPARASPAAPEPSTQDTFPHSRHTSLPCLTCHTVNRADHGLVFEVPRGCDLCHHQSLRQGTADAKDCARCHRTDALAVPTPQVVSIKVGTHAAVPRPVAFSHDRHRRTGCLSCHVPPELTPPDSVRTCQACHDQHHEARRDCAACHSRGDLPAEHSRDTHVACDACHKTATIVQLVPNRQFCLSCHMKEADHQPQKECTTCHFLQTPAEFRRHLVQGGGA